MEFDNKCFSCENLFDLDIIPLELPCFHLICLKCLKKSNISNNIICGKDNKTFDLSNERIPIDKKYFNFIDTNKDNKKIYCSKHEKKKIEFVHLENKDLLCSFCLYETVNPKKETKFFKQKEFNNDLKLIESQLISLNKLINDYLLKVEQMKLKTQINSNEIKILFKEISDLFKIPFKTDFNLDSFKRSNEIDNKIISSNKILTNSIDSKLFSTSIILNNHINKDYIMELFDFKIHDLKLLYRASENEFKASTFHEFCDEKGPNLVVIKANNKVFGGYSTASWTSDHNIYQKGNGSFLFSLEKRAKLMIYSEEKTQYAIWCHPNYGPIFGSGSDLSIFDLCDKNHSSYTDLAYTYDFEDEESRLKPDTKEAKEFLAGIYQFKVEEYEVFTINLK